ncbi:MAG: arabinose-5-phosphate isomerase [Candidatus Dactylopiibacterium carminicum]|uniref:Arabinose-5-phosphate isomerase n=1 Tax=Candidatus Dactylopiibacterium carminicum TaxID=857335 RepID=A0A272ERL4_9RHOO|nr:KpsF/GutQ family sugar-phosphate isomerase [Candidatus Dactylopiibacterium carminicum]KAF7598822.1 KpsF/GutQ family sugar-phosphate isomerase [Candidatus Dactylopiibacterium carminicum]PAS92722.1 MAG: arabinose-5-phosphate isomerase [Candidatus Dactylopiibacterium carminicum]PAS96170.1 MAG: arabinose-5-phosphate isomerase [Candidatus Dactylopiibacterium carminicum]PAS98843.1 MAG: arabinose-5-phosphate isomerase [Candidatus Dactylopiibacterium carminicum]
MNPNIPQASLTLAPDACLSSARRVLDIESRAVAALADRLDENFVRAVKLILAARGRVIVSGVGKSGHVGRKIAATMASTGTPAYFVHPGEAAHGDLGMVQPDDVLIALSNSGSAEELLIIVPLVKRMNAPLIAITGKPDSPLALLADAHLDAGVVEEACPLNLAPTASTTAALAIGDALAVALLEARGFGREDFARSHPGGALGRRLLTHVRDIMRTGDAIPAVREDADFGAALLEISRKGLGMTAVVDAENRVVGIFTDGDLRRLLETGPDLKGLMIRDVMHTSPRSIGPESLAVEVAELMDRHRISQVLVVDANRKLIGALNTHDLMNAKVI